MIHRHITSRIELERINAATRQCACSSLLSLKLYFLIQMSKLDSGRICYEMPGDSFLFGVPSYSCGYTSYFLDCIYSIAHEIEKQSFSVNVLVGAAILPPATFRIQPVWLNGTTYRHVIPTE